LAGIVRALTAGGWPVSMPKEVKSAFKSAGPCSSLVPRGAIRFIEIGCAPLILDLSRFLAPNRHPLRRKTLYL
jgi:hypothetical protein